MREIKDRRTFLTQCTAAWGLGSLFGMAWSHRLSETAYDGIKHPSLTVELAVKYPITRRAAIVDIPISTERLVSKESQKEVVKLFEREHPTLVVQRYSPWSDPEGNRVLRCVCAFRSKATEQDD